MTLEHPMCPPSSRRGFLAIAAAASAVSAGALAIAAMPTAAHQACVLPDPIFEAIKAHEDAELACIAATREIDRLFKAADDAGLPYEVKVLDHRNPPICLYVAASNYFEIAELVPGDEHEELRQFYCRRLTERGRERGAFWGFDPDDLMGEAADMEWQTLRHFARVSPTTLAGLFAKLTYADKLASDPDFDRFDDVDITQVLLNSLATAARSIVAGSAA